MKQERKNLAENRKARHEYFVEETYETGLELFGTEVKSIKMGKVNLKESYADIRNGELFVYSMHISPYEKGNIFNRDPLRPKKLLMHRSEIRRLSSLVSQKGYTLIPISLYLVKGFVKLELGLCIGKKLYDKRDDLAKKDAAREVERHMKEDYR
jgi:SsrA-binding protein